MRAKPRNKARAGKVARKLKAKAADLVASKPTEGVSGGSEERLAAELDAMTRLHKLATLSVHEVGLEQVLNEILGAAMAVSRSDFGNIQLLAQSPKPGSSRLRIVSQRGFPQWWIDFWDSVPEGQGSCGVALERRECVVVEDVEKSPIFAGTPALEIQLKAGVRAVQSTPIISRSGRPLGMFSTHFKTLHRPDARTLRVIELLARQAGDIIEQVQDRAALRESEKRFRALVSASSNVVYRMSPDWSEMRELAGKDVISDTRTPSRDWLEKYIHPDDQVQIIEAARKAIRTKSMFELGHRVRRADGSLGWALSRAVPLLDANGEITEWFGAASDVTEPRQAEEALRESETQFRTLANAIPQLCWKLDADGSASWFNDRWYEYTGTTPEQVKGSGWHSVHDAERLPKELKRWKESLATGTPFDMVTPLRGADGGFRPFLTRVMPVFDSQSKVIGWFGTNTDISEQWKIEEELRKAKDELAEQARRKDEFFALVSHELRNPLAAVTTAVQLLSDSLTAERRTFLKELIDRQATLLRRLVDDLMDLGRITLGQIGLKKERIDLSDFLQKVTVATRSAVAARGQEMVLRLPPERVVFMADRVRLEQIAANLLTNASKYTGRGGRIEASGVREGSEVVIRCKDNGSGIPLEMQKKIFEPFVRVEATGQSAEAGLGIGLALVKQLVELHGGRVSAESGGPGMGSEFVVRLPLVQAPSAQAALIEADPAPRARRALSIVLVEDNPDVAATLAIVMEQAGHKVRVFKDGPSAVSGLSRLKPNVAVLDIGLPVMDGYELLAKLRKKRNLQHTLFVGLSGFMKRAQTEESGGDFEHYFVKPVDPDKLLTFLVEMCSRAADAKPDQVRRAPEEQNPLRVLLVEDHADLAAMTAELLRGEGFEVRTALTGREALEAAPDFQPHLTLCDMRLPDIKGREVIHGLRSNPLTQRTHAVILTALSEEEIRAFNRNAQKMGVDQFIRKPLTLDAIRDLRAIVRPSQDSQTRAKKRPTNRV